MDTNQPITVAELQDVLRLHALWLRKEDGGRRADLRWANLREADLRWANLREADLRWADLREANLILIGQDVRGYLFYAWHDEDNVVVIRAGCRMFVGIAAARNHWTASHTDDAILHTDCLSLVDRCETIARARGWLLEASEATEEDNDGQ